MAGLLIAPGEALPAFLREAAAQPFSLGHWDCAMTLANWVQRITGVDPAPELRGAYASRDEWRAIAAQHGGLAALVDRFARRAGLRPTGSPRRGDIGVVETGVGQVGAIRVDRGWVVKTVRGVSAGPFSAVVAWTPDRQQRPLAWVAGYPRSGTTWLRLMMHVVAGGGRASDGTLINAIGETSTEEADRSHWARLLAETVPERDWRAAQAVRAQVHDRLREGGRRIVRTHSALSLGGEGTMDLHGDRAVYVVRHPAAVLTSFAAMLGVSAERAAEIMADSGATTLNSATNAAEPVSSWSDHVAGWADAPDVLVVRYEDMLASPASVLQQVASHLLVGASMDGIANAVAATRFDRLRAEEAECGFVESTGSGPFFRRGRPDAEIPDALARALRDRHGPMMARFGY